MLISFNNIRSCTHAVKRLSLVLTAVLSVCGCVCGARDEHTKWTEEEKNETEAVNEETISLLTCCNTHTSSIIISFVFMY